MDTNVFVHKRIVDRLFRLEDPFRGHTHPERFAQVPDPDDMKFTALAHAAVPS